MDENEWPISILSTYEEMHLDFFFNICATNFFRGGRSNWKNQKHIELLLLIILYTPGI